MDMYNRRVDLIKYNKEEVAYGDSEIKRLGIEGQYVCIFARDSQYLCQQYNSNPTYFRHGMRDMDIRDFGQAVGYLDSQGIQSVRMGKVVAGRCDMNNCIDYASMNHQDFLDLYLISKCKFFAGSLSGIVELAHLQNKPVLVIGLTQFGVMNAITYYEDDLYIPKKVLDKKADRYLTLQEMLDTEMEAGIRLKQYYEEHDLIFVDPTQQEICDAVKEMNQKLDCTYQADKETEALTEKYFEVWEDWLKTRGYEESYYFGSKLKICDCYLKNNQYLLGS
jgi:putative glycosyltransferase (TIGR04372 family)